MSRLSHHTHKEEDPAVLCLFLQYETDKRCRPTYNVNLKDLGLVNHLKKRPVLERRVKNSTECRDKRNG